MRRATHCSADQLTQAMQAGGFRWRPAMLTLTYREERPWEPRDISETLKRIRQWMGRRGHKLRLAWVAELTARGAVHYHACIWLPKGLTLPKPDKQGWWPHGHTRIEWARRPISYMVKYTSKGEDSFRLDEHGNFQRITFPKGCRIHGRSGLDLAQRRIVAWWCLPRYVRENFSKVGSRIVRANGGGWLDHDTGQWLPSQQPPK